MATGVENSRVDRSATNDSPDLVSIFQRTRKTLDVEGVYGLTSPITVSSYVKSVTSRSRRQHAGFGYAQVLFR